MSLSFTVTATQTGSVAIGLLLRVKVLTGASVVQNGATASQNGAAAHQANITTTVTGSVVYGAVFDVGSTALTANGNTTVIDSTHLTDGITHGSCKATSATGTPGSISIGCSAPADAGLLALAEILASGTITEDASSPAPVSGTVSTITTAAFTPPPSLLAALVTSNGGSGTVSITMSDSSGLGLKWQELIPVHTAGTGYAGVWVAVFNPAAPRQRLVVPRRAPARAFAMFPAQVVGVNGAPPVTGTPVTAGKVLQRIQPPHRAEWARITAAGVLPVPVTGGRAFQRILPPHRAAWSRVAVAGITPVPVTGGRVAQRTQPPHRAAWARIPGTLPLGPAGTVPVLMAARTEVMSRSTGRVIRR